MTAMAIKPGFGGDGFGGANTGTGVKRGKPQSADSLLGQYLRQDFFDYRQNVVPLLNQEAQAINDNALLKNAIAESKTLGARAQGRADRNAARYDMGYANTAQKQGLAREVKRTNFANSANVVNQGRIMQQDLNDQRQRMLANAYLGMRAESMKNLNTASGIQSDIYNAQRSIDAQSTAAKWGALGSIGGMMTGYNWG